MRFIRSLRSPLVHFHSGDSCLPHSEPDPDKPNEKRIVLRAVEGFNPPPMELAETGPAD